MDTYRAELHVHTVLSPCAGVEMIPPVVVREALQQGIQLIAITDHNSTDNVRAVMDAARGSGLVVLPGMELQTREEVHLLCWFDTADQADAWHQVVLSKYPDLKNNPDYFGEQYVVDASGGFIRHETRLLLASTYISLEEAVQGVGALGGLVIPAHVDRRAYGLIPVLGLVPPLFDALEISRYISPETARQRYPQIGTLKLIQGGDVHFIDGFLGAVELEIDRPCVEEIRMALRGLAGRRCHHRRLTNHQ